MYANSGAYKPLPGELIMNDNAGQTTFFYSRHPISADIIATKLQAARGHLRDVRPEELWPHDQDHYGVGAGRPGRPGGARADFAGRCHRARPGRRFDGCRGEPGSLRPLLDKARLEAALLECALARSVLRVKLSS